MASTVTKMSAPGRIASIGALAMRSCALLSMFPQLGSGGWMPRPRKLSTDSSRMTWPTARVPGDEERRRDVREDVPHHDPDRARPDCHPRPHVVALAHAQGRAPHQAGGARPAEEGHDRDDAQYARRLRHRPLGRNAGLGEVQRREHDEEGEEGGGGHPVGEAHEGRVHPAPEVARDESDEGSEEGGGEGARDSDRERHPPPVEKPKAGVAAELVGAEPVGERRALEAGEEVHPVGVEAAHRLDEGGGEAQGREPREHRPRRETAPAAARPAHVRTVLHR